MIFGVVALHVWALHVVGQNNPAGIDPRHEKDTVAFTPYATLKDIFFVAVFCIIYAWFVFYVPDYLLAADNFIPAKSESDSNTHRSGMVLPSVLRDLALNPEQTRWRDRPVRVDPRSAVPALARQLQG